MHQQASATATRTRSFPALRCGSRTEGTKASCSSAAILRTRCIRPEERSAMSARSRSSRPARKQTSTNSTIASSVTLATPISNSSGSFSATGFANFNATLIALSSRIASMAIGIRKNTAEQRGAHELRNQLHDAGAPSRRRNHFRSTVPLSIESGSALVHWPSMSGTSRAAFPPARSMRTSAIAPLYLNGIRSA